MSARPGGMPAPSVLDPVLVRLLPAAWAALPILATVGLLCLVFVTLPQAIGRGAELWLPAAAAILCAPILQYAVRRVSEGIFDLDSARRPLRQRVLTAVVLVGIPGALAAATACASIAAEHAALFGVVWIAGCALTTLSVLVSLVALPLSVARGDARLISVVKVAVYAALRRPLAPLAVIMALATAVWATLSWLPSALILVPGLVAVLSVAASWAVLRPAGVALPNLVTTLPRFSFVRTRSR